MRPRALDLCCRAGGGGRGAGDISAWSDAMGIDWMTRREIVEAVPPSYAEYIGQQAMTAIDGHRGKMWRRPKFSPARVSAIWDGSLSQAKIGQVETSDFEREISHG